MKRYLLFSSIMILIGLSIGLTINVSAEESIIPSWIKNTAEFWVKGQIGDSEFIQALQYLVKEEILVIPSEQPKNESTLEPIPEPTIDLESKPLGIASFVDQSKDPQSYVDRYYNEPSYRDWFDRNYPQYESIYQAVGLEESTVSKLEPVTEKITESNILTNSKFDVVFSDPNKYKGKWAKLDGEITQTFRDSNQISLVFSLSDSFDISKRIWVLSDNTNLKFKENECYTVEGKILGGYEAELVFTGAKSEIPTIQLEKYQSISCLDAKYPAITTYNVNKSQILGKIKITINKIELAEEHTRVLLEVENLSNSNSVTFYDFNSKIIQNKSQYLADSYPFFDVEIDSINSEIPSGIIEKGYIFFEPVNEGSFKILLEATENGESWTDYKEYQFEFSLN